MNSNKEYLIILSALLASLIFLGSESIFRFDTKLDKSELVESEESAINHDISFEKANQNSYCGGDSPINLFIASSNHYKIKFFDYKVKQVLGKITSLNSPPLYLIFCSLKLHCYTSKQVA